jgi:hypothetical protein
MRDLDASRLGSRLLAADTTRLAWRWIRPQAPPSGAWSTSSDRHCRHRYRAPGATCRRPDPSRADDGLVTLKHSEHLKAQLEKAEKKDGTDFHLETYEHQGHGFTGDALKTSRAATVAFFLKNL